MKSSYKTMTYNEILQQTDSALLLSTNKGLVWLPKSQVALHKISKEAIIPLWLFNKLKFFNKIVSITGCSVPLFGEDDGDPF